MIDRTLVYIHSTTPLQQDEIGIRQHMWQQAFVRPSTAAIDSTQILAHAVTALRQDPGWRATQPRCSKGKGGTLFLILSPFPPPSSPSLSLSPTCDQPGYSRFRHMVVPEISSCIASPLPGTATNRALAATGSEISLAALLLIISPCTCTPSKPASPPPYHYYSLWS